MLPIIGKHQEGRLDLVISYLESHGDPKIRFVQDFFREHEIKQEEFIEYMDKWGRDIMKAKMKGSGLLKN